MHQKDVCLACSMYLFPIGAASAVSPILGGTKAKPLTEKSICWFFLNDGEAESANGYTKKWPQGVTTHSGMKGHELGAGLRFGFQKGELPVDRMGKSKAEKGQSQGQTESFPTVGREESYCSLCSRRQVSRKLPLLLFSLLTDFWNSYVIFWLTADENYRSSL